MAEGLCPSQSCQMEQDKRLSSAVWDRGVHVRLWFYEAPRVLFSFSGHPDALHRNLKQESSPSSR